MSTTYSAGIATAYGAAVRGGYTGTYQQFCADLANLPGVVETLENLSASATTLPEGSSATASYSNGNISFGIPKGDTGETGATGATGATGNGIASIAKTGTSGLVDTYTITFTNGNTFDFTVTNGQVTNFSLNKVTNEAVKGIDLIQYATYPGFIGSNGAINAQSANKEVYSEKIPVNVFDKINIDLEYASSASMWIAVATYDSSETFLARTVLVNSVTQQSYNGIYTVPSGVSYIAFTWRAYTGSTFSLSKQYNWLTDKTDNPYKKYNGSYVWGSVTSAVSPDHTRAKTEPIRGNGIVHINNALDSGYKVVLKIWSDAAYGTSEFDSGFMTTNEYSHDVNGKYYVVGFKNSADDTTDVNLDTLATSKIQIYEELPGTDGVIYGINDLISEREYRTNNVVKTITHRGDDIYAPQCTAPAYILARKHGIFIAENDLWLSGDNEFVMWHDTSLNRLGYLVDINGYLMYTDGSVFYYVDPETSDVYTWDGDDYVSSAVSLASLTRCDGANYAVTGLNLSVLKRIDFGVYRGAQFKGTQILTLDEWVLLCKQLGMEIYIDRKLTYTNELLTSAANIVKKYGMGDHASWLGLNTEQITLLRTIIPNSRCGILAHPDASSIVAYRDYNVGRGFFFNGDAKNGMTAQAIQLGLNAGYEVEVWYVDYGGATTEEVFTVLRNAVSYGVTGITTDHYRASEAFDYLLNSY